ncbi:MAG: peptide deformylase [Candidatus Margulisbacteria bacterium]|nr:peptide deformylase [Candidatus Margulisiibacteriota bacterium]
MAVLHVLTGSNPILKQKALSVTAFDAGLETLLSDMLETMRVYEGVGLAATQVGILQRVLVAEYRKCLLKLINPVIVFRKGSVTAEEGCLSLPDVRLMVERASHIVVEAQLPDGSPVSLPLKGFMARIMQHELDHLDGVLIIDRSSILAPAL